MRSVRVVVVLILLPFTLVWGALVTGAAPAQAQTEDVVRNLDVHYDVRADGTVRATYDLDWDFGSTGRHGINFGIVTRETWDQDPSLEAVYLIEDIDVSSPDDVPVDVHRTDAARETTLRIGDPDVTLDVERARYRISYVMHGGLRTFDGVPELFLDVTGPDYPRIDNVTVTITAPGDIPRARCLVGPDECEVRLEGGRAVLSGREVHRYDIITAVAELEPGTVDGAEPDLEPRRFSRPALTDLSSTVTVDERGVAHIREDFTVLSASARPRVEWTMPLMRGTSTWQRRLYEITTPVVTDAAGNDLPVDRRVFRSPSSDSETVVFTALLPNSTALGDEVSLTATYTVTGAVDSHDGTAEFSWPVSTINARQYDLPTRESYEWRLPVAAETATCRPRARVDDPEARCTWLEAPTIGPERVSKEWPEAESGSAPTHWIVLSVPAAAVGHTRAGTEWAWMSMMVAGGTAGLGGGAALIALGRRLGRLRFGQDRHVRFADTAPGEVGEGSAVTTRPRRGPVPVRFHPPEEHVARVGFVLDGRTDNRQLAATLVHMAVNDAVRLGSRPLTIYRHLPDRVTGRLEQTIERALPEQAPGILGAAEKQKLRAALEADLRFARGSSGLFRPRVRSQRRHRVIPYLAAVALLPIGLLLQSAGLVPGAFWWSLFFAAVLVVGILTTRINRPAPLTAEGSAVREQAEGFRTFLSTATVRSMNFEADRDVFSRYLPWAVLFGQVERWTEVCRDLAATGAIDNPDLSFWVGSSSFSAHTFARDVSALSKDLTPPPPSGGSSGSGGSGGSGGSSGFSSGSSGGSGGGGTSASSW